MESNDGWRVAREPNLLQRLRARRAMQAYEKARVPYDQLARQIETLEAEREAMVLAIAARVRAGETIDRRSGEELLRYNKLFADLERPWEKAEANMKKAHAAVTELLDELGFEDVSGVAPEDKD
ncbi:hypothetical protein [Novosphingobium resinovorum]|nr:hypothetical protein [Novosphingobium resinovorum]